jgi:transcription elongation factor SPT6
MSDDDLFGDQDDDEDDDEDNVAPGVGAAQKAEALRLKRQKRDLAKQERRQKALQKKMEKRKAQLRKAFEPVQLIENFCTDRDDDIRKTDVPERMFDLYKEHEKTKSQSTKFPTGDDAPLTDEEQDEAAWIIQNVPAITLEYRNPPPSAAAMQMQMQQNEHDLYQLQNEQRAQLVSSIVYALRYMIRDYMEPMFVQQYRADRVTSVAVRENLHALLEQDVEWERIKAARDKVEHLLDTVTTDTDKDEAAGGEEEMIIKLEAQLKDAKEQLDASAKKETTLKTELEELKQQAETKKDDEDDDLFGNDDDDDDEDDETKKQQEEEVCFVYRFGVVCGAVRWLLLV